MPLGSFRLNGLSKRKGPSGARASAATFGSNGGPTYTTTAKFGSHSIETTTTTNRVYTITVDPADTSWYFRSNKIWTVEFFSNALSKGNDAIRSIFGTNGINNGYTITDPVNNGTYQFNFHNSGTRLSDAHLANGLPNQNTWYHWAIVSDGTGNIKLYSNGTQRYSGSASSTSTTSRTISFGHFSSGGSPQNSNFAFDEVRISNNVRYTSGFTPPTGELSNDVNTLALFHFNNSALDDAG